MRRTLSGLVMLGLLAGAACSTGDALFPETGTLTLQILDRTLAGQAATEPSYQFAKWTIRGAEGDVPGAGTVNFLRAVPPCEVGQRLGVLGNNCGITGLALEAGAASTITVRLEIGSLELVRAKAPVTTEDTDGDTVLDADDNCPFVANTDQADANDDDVGDACTTNGLKDSDDDTIADVADNCVFFPNPGQQNTVRGDGFFDGVGDACEEKVEVTIPLTGLVIRRADVPFSVRDQGVTILTFDFKSRDWCPHDATTCTLDPDDVVVGVQ